MLLRPSGWAWGKAWRRTFKLFPSFYQGKKEAKKRKRKNWRWGSGVRHYWPKVAPIKVRRLQGRRPRSSELRSDELTQAKVSWVQRIIEFLKYDQFLENPHLGIKPEGMLFPSVFLPKNHLGNGPKLGKIYFGKMFPEKHGSFEVTHTYNI